MRWWWRIDDRAVDDAALCLLPPRTFRRKFKAALAGELNEFTPFMRPGRDRPGESVWAVLRSEVFERDNYTCTYCGERGGKLECDHIIPVAKGGGHDLANLTTACRPCNRSKRDKTLAEWMQ